MKNTVFSASDFEENKHEYGNRKTLNGAFRGIVEENADPMGLGRLKVRVLALHGEENGQIKSQDLPWSNACFPPGGGSDFGVFVIPPKGANVWVMFEQGDSQYPLWFGSWKTASSGGKALSSPKPDDPQHIQRGQSMGNKTWEAPAGSELPREAQMMANHEPTVQTWGKSPKGHTIAVEERDGVERLQVTDRAGNVFVMECAVKEEENAGNKSQRGTRSVLTGDALDRAEKMRDGGGKVTLQDLAQSMIEMASHLGDEKITIVANDGEGGIQTGKNRQRFEFLAGANRMIMESVRDGKVLSRITLDANSGVITIEGEVVVDVTSPLVNITAEHINLNGQVNIAGDATISGRLTGGIES